MLERFYPKKHVDSVWDMDFQMYYDQGIRGVIFDIDNTLVPHGEAATRQTVELFRKLNEIGLDTCLISNNQEPRVTSFALAVHSKFIYDAHKPAKKNYIKAMEMMNTDQSSTIFIGDQLFTDIYGANRIGIPSILVNKIDKKEEIQIVLKRYLEKIVLRKWEKSLMKDNMQ